jgi:hypothetical protein
VYRQVLLVTVRPGVESRTKTGPLPDLLILSRFGASRQQASLHTFCRPCEGNYGSISVPGPRSSQDHTESFDNNPEDYNASFPQILLQSGRTAARLASLQSY